MLLTRGERGQRPSDRQPHKVVQPAVSQRVHKLEDELGVDLVTRGRSAALTRAGERVARRARTVLDEIDAILEETAQPDGALQGHLTIGTMHWLGHVDLPAILAAFSRQHPAVAIELAESTTPNMLAGVREGTLDVSFVSLPDDAVPRRLFRGRPRV